MLVSEQLFHQSLIFFRNVTPKKYNTRGENIFQFWVLKNIYETEWSEMEAENRKGSMETKIQVAMQGCQKLVKGGPAIDQIITGP